MVRFPNWAPHILCAIVGISAWIEINGIFSELGLMKNLPEGKSIASIIVIIVQIGTLVQLLFSLLPRKPQLRWSMVLVLSLGVSSLVFLAFLWDTTYYVFGAERSVMLYVGTFIAAGADCLSNIVFWPYVGQFPRSYITAMGTGESLSSAVSAITTSTQKAIGYSPSVFFVVLTAIVLVCSSAFAYLETRYASDLSEEARLKSVSDAAVLPTASADVLNDSTETDGIEQQSPPWRTELPTLSVIAGIAFVQNALNPSLLPFACKGYTNAHWISQNALFVASPVMSISASFFKPRKSIVPAVCVWIATSVFITVAAALPSPVIADQATGTGLMAAISILSGSALAYSKVSAMLMLRSKQMPPEYGRQLGLGNKEYMQKLMTAAGISMQVGSVTGAVLMFTLVQIVKVFPSK